jgi:hypothetical protein
LQFRRTFNNSPLASASSSKVYQAGNDVNQKILPQPNVEVSQERKKNAFVSVEQSKAETISNPREVRN